MKNKLICFLLLMIIIFSSILIYKIDQTPKYDPDLYAQIYKEYEEITNVIDSTQKIEETISVNSSGTKTPTVIYKNSFGNAYKTIGAIKIPKINISYPIINECTEENLNIAPAKLLGPIINTTGNLVVVGHNNWNKEFFSNLNKLENDDLIELTDLNGNKLTYKVYDTYKINQDDFSCLEQDTSGRTELTLITCIKYQKTKRLVVKCVAT